MVPEIIDMDMPVEGVFHNLVIAQIKKDYAGQGQKVMNAMWGAGQMMFNKILVLADEHVKIQDYESLARYAFRHLDPSTDLVFSNGPMDVLDHSCSKMGFGGKMGIDGTGKFEEESEHDRPSADQVITVDSSSIKASFPEIKIVNDSLLSKGITCLLVSIKKERKHHIKQLHQSLGASGLIDGVKMILYVEDTVDANDLPVALWRFCNNLDPKRDNVLFQQDDFSSIGLDGTRKTKEFDNFQRDWPNIIVAADATIEAVDKKWNELGLGSFIPSPSLKFKNQIYGEEAIVS